MKKLTGIHYLLIAILLGIGLFVSQVELLQCKCNFGHARELTFWRQLKLALELGVLCSSAALLFSHLRARRTQLERWLVTRTWLALITTLFIGGVVTGHVMSHKYERLDAAWRNPPTRLYFTPDGGLSAQKP